MKITILLFMLLISGCSSVLNDDGCVSVPYIDGQYTCVVQEKAKYSLCGCEEVRTVECTDNYNGGVFYYFDPDHKTRFMCTGEDPDTECQGAKDELRHYCGCD